MKYLLLLLIPAVIMAIVIRGKINKFSKRGPGTGQLNYFWLVVMVLFIAVVYYFTFTYQPQY